MADGNILSDFGIDLLEEEIDDVIFQTNEFLTDATFTGSQGPFWWIALFCAFRRSYPLVNQLLVKSCSARQIPDGTKTGQNHRKIKSRTHSVRKPLLRFLLFDAKVQFCPVKTKHFFGNVLLHRRLWRYLVFAEDIASGSAPMPCFTFRTSVKTCFTPSALRGEALASSAVGGLTR